LGAKINGPLQICEQTSAQFTGSTLLPGQPQWLWIFDDGSTTTQQSPVRKYNLPGDFAIKLVVNNNGCADTVSQTIVVHPKPGAAIASSSTIVCEGSSVLLSASGGNTYKWSPPENLNNNSIASVSASPVNTTTYVVTISDTYGCVNKDSVKIDVVHPFTMHVKEDASICFGESVALEALGADNYKWINNTTGLSSTIIPNPIAAPLSTTIYTVTGTDSNKCFTDSANIKVTVNSLPLADAGESAVIEQGASYNLRPSTSNDVVKWSWSPPDYLSCIDCKEPVATPALPQLYILTVTNAAGCTASDTVSVKLLCSGSRIYIPNLFTPNNDGVNDLFSITGDGVHVVSLRIYNRWGILVFEHKNFDPGDSKSSWNARYKGEPVPQGSYVYVAEILCNKQTFIKQGSVIVLY
jgi:gliding motility-associated-like protein